MYIIKTSDGKYVSGKYGGLTEDLQKARVFKSKGGATNVINNQLPPLRYVGCVAVAVELREK